MLFRRSGSRDFARALECAERQPGFCEEPTPGHYAVSFNQDQLDGCDALLALVGRWQHTRITLNGQSVEAERLARLLACYRARLASPDRRAHCAGAAVHQTAVGAVRQLFPCRLIPISEGNEDGWFHHGHLTRDGVFVLDKGGLRQAVAQGLSDSLAAHCPALFPAEVDGVVDHLPDRIDPGRDPRWVYREGWQNGRFVPVGVQKRADLPSAGPRPQRAPEAPGARPPAEEAVRGPGPHEPVAGRAATPIGTVRYADIGGLGPQIRVIRENVELPLRFPELFSRLGVDPHRGILLCGPPGTGKTMLAKALASECQAGFVAINGPEILSKWRGDSEANLRRVFEEAAAAAPAVVLIDELDSIAPDRSRVQHNHEAVLVSQLLTLLDGLADRGQVVAVATTNRPELIDPAVRRPGRLDLLLEIGVPDEACRADILRIHSRRMPLAPDVDLAALAAATPTFAGAHLAAVCREAGMECLRGVVGTDAGGAFTLQPAALDGLAVTAEHFQRALAVVARAMAPQPA